MTNFINSISMRLKCSPYIKHELFNKFTSEKMMLVTMK